MVSGSAQATEAFAPAEINDIIKSLMVQDLGGGSVGVVSYASQDPVEKTLKSFGVDIAASPRSASFSTSFAASRSKSAGHARSRSIIVGVEKLKMLAPDKSVIEYDVLNVLTETACSSSRSASWAASGSRTKKVDAGFARRRDRPRHDADKKKSSCCLTARAERKASRICSKPIWKTSYRLVLDSAKKPFLQAGPRSRTRPRKIGKMCGFR